MGNRRNNVTSAEGNLQMSNWYVIVNEQGEYLPLAAIGWVSDMRQAEVFTAKGDAKSVLRRVMRVRPDCRIERIPRLPDRIPRGG